jgi:choline dehydrogenase
MSFWHQTSSAKMGRDAMSVVDGNLKVFGVDNLRIADASIMPRVTTGNTMAPCVIIGERAAEIIRDEHQLETASASRSDRFLNVEPQSLSKSTANQRTAENYNDLGGFE